LRRRAVIPLLAGSAAILLAAGAIAVWLLPGILSKAPSPKNEFLTEKDTIVVADFENATGDPVFDGTIKQALLMDLEQSPFLKILPEPQVREMRRLMARPSGEPLAGEVARELCQRAGGKAVLSGSIASMGQLYVIGMTAAKCATGEPLVREQVRAQGKEQVLASLDKAAVDLRARLGDSLSNIQKYNTPLELVTTPSLKALQAYSEGMLARNTQGDVESIPYFQRAIELDPTFAMGYNRLGGVYYDAMQFDLAAAMFRKAFALREHVSQRERYYIEARYYHFVVADLDKTLAVYEDWRREFPRDSVPLTGAGMIHNALGDYDKTVTNFQEALQEEPNLPYNYTNLAEVLIDLERRQEARSVLSRMQSLGMQETDQYLVAYQLAFLDGDTAEMQRQAALAAGKPEAAEILLLFQAQTEADLGRFGEVRRLIQQAAQLSRSLHEQERAANWTAQGALFESEVGNRSRATEDADSALRLSHEKDIRVLAALALARAGDSKRAEMLAAGLRLEFPLDTILNRYWLPAIEAAVQLSKGDSSSALEHLEIAKPYELGQPSSFQVLAISPMVPVYLRGESYLAAGKGAEATTEFEGMLRRPGLAQNYPLQHLARLGLARAAALRGETSKAASLYGEFLLAWKNADSDLPLLKQARNEAASLKGRTDVEAP
jgi:tetratricopeptide (TPR) repeat protein